MSEWRETTLGEVCELKRGYDLPSASREFGDVPIVSSSGVSGFHSVAKVKGPGVVTGRYGTLGQVFFMKDAFWPLNTSLYVRDFKGNDPYFVALLLESLELGKNDVAAAVPGVNRNQLHGLLVLAPDVPTQRRVSGVVQTIDDLLENNRRRLGVLEQMAQAIYREWFVRFRYPGHEDTTFVDSPLGPIPDGWQARTVASVASPKRYAVTSGPFGSKLGRADYVTAGVPVLRGANLKVGGGFDESELVFVSEDKAEDLRSCVTIAGDIVVTQRGTLGQVGLIPTWCEFDRYILSQSQMKVTVDDEQATPEFFYAQFRTAETTERFVAQAMSSGVPHVNLALLREFEVLVPPIELQRIFTGTVHPLASSEGQLRRANRELAAIRDMLLPKLVRGQIDVSTLDLDALLEPAS